MSNNREMDKEKKAGIVSISEGFVYVCGLKRSLMVGQRSELGLEHTHRTYQKGNQNPKRTKRCHM